MRKEDIRSLIIYSIMGVAMVVVFLTVYSNQLGLYLKNNQLLFTFAAFAVSVLINVIGLELLHVLGAVIGGYKITGFNIFGFAFFKKENEWKFGFRDFDGISGETKIAPKKANLKPKLQIWLPLFGYIIELAICVTVSSIVKNSANPKAPWLIPACTMMIVISSLLTFYNIVPFKLDSTTDGYKMRLFTKPINIEAYNKMLEIQEQKRIGEEVKNIPIFEEITEFTAEINTLAMYKFLEDEVFDEAEKILDKLIESKHVMDASDYNRLIAQKLYLDIITKPIEEAKKFYDETCPTELRRFIANDMSMPCIRAYIMIAGMIEESESEVAFAKSKIKKAMKRALESEIDAEEKLLAKALDFVYNAHPKWKKENAAN